MKKNPSLCPFPFSASATERAAKISALIKRGPVFSRHLAADAPVPSRHQQLSQMLQRMGYRRTV